MKPRLTLLLAALIIANAIPVGASHAGPARAMVLASDPQATQAGTEILRQGGTAADAAIAAAMVLGVVSPHSAGPGGVAGALTYKAQNAAITAWDGSAVAPAAAGPDLFVGRDGTSMRLADLVPGGRAVGVPGGLRMLEALHRAEGKLPWDRLIAPAIALAQDGYTVSPSLAAALAALGSGVGEPANVLALFRDTAGNLPKPGEQRRNRELADTLRIVAASGADGLLRGKLAADVATAVRNEINPGLLTADDLAAFTVPQRSAFCTPYRAMRLCSLGPPDAGGTALVRAFAVLDHKNFPRLDPAGAESMQMLLQTWRRSTADAMMHLADPDFMQTHADDLLTGAPALAVIGPKRPVPTLPAGTTPLAADGMTANVLVVDQDGNAASLVLSLHSVFGAQIATHGFLLNNALAGFAPRAKVVGQAVVNHVDGSKRPLHDLAPVIGLDAQGKLRLLGGAMGPDAATSLAQLLVRIVDFHLAPRIALASPFWRLRDDGLILDDVLGGRQLADLLHTHGESVTLRPASARIMLLSVGDDLTLANSNLARAP